MKHKVLFSLLLVVIIIYSFSFSSIISAETKIETQVYVEDYVLEYAKQFVEGEENVSISEIIPIFNIDGEVVRYCVNYVINNNPYAYIILDRYKRDVSSSPLIEFSIGENYFNKDVNNVVLNEIEYALEKNNNIILKNNKVISKNVARKTYVKNHVENGKSVEDGYIDGINIVDVKNLQSVKDFAFFGPFRQYNLVSMVEIGNGICGATVAMNVLKYYYDYDTDYYDKLFYKDTSGKIDIDKTYQKLLSYQKSDNPYNIQTQDLRKQALTRYIKENTQYKVSITKYLINTWTIFYNDIKNNKLVDMRYSGMDGGHAVLALAAAELKKGSLPGTRYLAVADTWNNNIRWLNFDYHDNVSGMSIKIS